MTITKAVTPAKKKTSKGKGLRKPYVKRACVHCKNAHSACDNARPCKRCISLGCENECVDAERKKPAPRKARKKKTKDGETLVAANSQMPYSQNQEVPVYPSLKDYVPHLSNAAVFSPPSVPSATATFSPFVQAAQHPGHMNPSFYYTPAATTSSPNAVPILFQYMGNAVPLQYQNGGVIPLQAPLTATNSQLVISQNQVAHNMGVGASSSSAGLLPNSSKHMALPYANGAIPLSNGPTPLSSSSSAASSSSSTSANKRKNNPISIQTNETSFSFPSPSEDQPILEDITQGSLDFSPMSAGTLNQMYEQVEAHNGMDDIGDQDASSETNNLNENGHVHPAFDMESAPQAKRRKASAQQQHSHSLEALMAESNDKEEEEEEEDDESDENVTSPQRVMNGAEDDNDDNVDINIITKNASMLENDGQGAELFDNILGDAGSSNTDNLIANMEDLLQQHGMLTNLNESRGTQLVPFNQSNSLQGIGIAAPNGTQNAASTSKPLTQERRKGKLNRYQLEELLKMLWHKQQSQTEEIRDLKNLVGELKNLIISQNK